MGAATDLPNVVLVVFDTARADGFEPYGAAAGSTPTIADLARRGRAHPRAYAPSSWTVPSHLSLFTGLLPRAAGMHLGVQTGSFFQDLIGHHEARWLPSVLQSCGYRTVGVSANGWIASHAGFDRGFDVWREVRSSRQGRLGAADRRSKLRWGLEALRANLDDGAEEISRLLRTELRKGGPFFCFINLVECHSPYLPPKPFNSLGWRGRLEAARDANRYCTFDAFWRQAFGMVDVPAGSLARMRSQYDDSIRQLDSWLARLLGLLDEASVLDDTQVIVTSDHGENFGEGGKTGHTFSLDDRLIRVPFVTAGPLSLDGGPALNLWQLPGLLAEALAVPDQPWAAVGPSDVSVAEFVAPARRDDPEALQKSADLPPHAVHLAFNDYQCATDGRWKLLRDASGETLVDLAADPLETDPQPAGPDPGEQRRLGVLRAALDEADRAAMGTAPWGAGGHGSAGATSPGGPGAAAGGDEAAALEEQMRLLGYL